MISTGKDYNYYYESQTYTGPEEETFTDLALGFGLGGKFVTKNGFFMDLSTGLGRNIFTTTSPTIVGQFNVNLGHRF